ncbi:MAG TPA: PHB depolymerase family esterase [Chitinophagales bacterium]|jgi:polyhydroxybutyrate depolymerase|nr:PHB depolymerase family esterase [Chitinophagales bacterium]
MKQLLLIITTFIITIFGITSCSIVDNVPLSTISVDGKTRQYYFYKPAKLQAGTPLLIVLHGYGDNAFSIMNLKGFNKIADRNNFAVCYPQGTKDNKGINFWNVGFKGHETETIDDVHFIEFLVNKLVSENNLDATRVFVTGESNGGFMCNMLATRKPHLFKAIAPVIGSMTHKIYDSSAATIPIPVMMINGTSDVVVPWSGDTAYDMLPIDTVINFWTRTNRSTHLTIDTLPDINKLENSIVIRYKNSDADFKNQVWLYKIVNGGHIWPNYFTKKDFDASEEIWTFFKNQ